MKKFQIISGKKLFGLYQGVVLIICFFTVVLFFLWYIPESMQKVFAADGMVEFKSVTYSLVHILITILGMLCIVHVLSLFIQMVFTKHSFIWLLTRQAGPLVAPFIVMVFIKMISGQLNNVLSDLVVGVFAGIASSVIVLLLDRNHRLADTVVKYAAWEYGENKDGTAEQEVAGKWTQNP